MCGSRLRELLLELPELDRHQHVVRAEAQVLVEVARRVVRDRDVEREVRHAAGLQPPAELSDQLAPDAAPP